MRAGLDTSDLAIRRQLICALVKQVEIDAEAVHIVYRVSPRPFAQTAQTDGKMPHCWGRSCGPLGRKVDSEPKPRAEVISSRGQGVSKEMRKRASPT